MRIFVVTPPKVNKLVHTDRDEKWLKNNDYLTFKTPPPTFRY